MSLESGWEGGDIFMILPDRILQKGFEFFHEILTMLTKLYYKLVGRLKFEIWNLLLFILTFFFCILLIM